MVQRHQAKDVMHTLEPDKFGINVFFLDILLVTDFIYFVLVVIYFDPDGVTSLSLTLTLAASAIVMTG